MRPRITSAARAGTVTTALVLVLWLAVHAGTAGGEAPFPVSDWAGPSYGRDPRQTRPPLDPAASRDATRDKQTLAFDRPSHAVEDDLPHPRPIPQPSPAPTGSPQPTHSATPAPTPTTSISLKPTPADPTPTPPRRYAMEVSISANRSSARPGESYTYTIRVRNTGTGTLRNISGETHVPSGTTEADCSGSGQFRVCTGTSRESAGEHDATSVGTLGPGEVFTYTLDVIVKNSTDKGYKIRNHAHATSPDTGRVSSGTITVLVV